MGGKFSQIEESAHPFPPGCVGLHPLATVTREIYRLAQKRPGAPETAYAINLWLLRLGTRRAIAVANTDKYREWGAVVCAECPSLKASLHGKVRFYSVHDDSELILIVGKRADASEVQRLLALPAGLELDRRLGLLLGLSCFSGLPHPNSTPCLQMILELRLENQDEDKPIVLADHRCSPQTAYADATALRKVAARVQRDLLKQGLPVARCDGHVRSKECSAWFEDALRTSVDPADAPSLPRPPFSKLIDLQHAWLQYRRSQVRRARKEKGHAQETHVPAVGQGDPEASADQTLVAVPQPGV